MKINRPFAHRPNKPNTNPIFSSHSAIRLSHRCKKSTSKLPRPAKPNASCLRSGPCPIPLEFWTSPIPNMTHGPRQPHVLRCLFSPLRILPLPNMTRDPLSTNHEPLPPDGTQNLLKKRIFYSLFTKFYSLFTKFYSLFTKFYYVFILFPLAHPTQPPQLDPRTPKIRRC